MSDKNNNAVHILLAAIVMTAVALCSTSLMAQDGATLFKTKCAMCHGPDGKGDSPMGKKLNVRDLGSPDVQKQSDAELATIIEKGKNKMPAFGGKLSAEQITALVSHIRELGKARKEK
jgi:mono/diheme cytochrome c family protein